MSIVWAENLLPRGLEVFICIEDVEIMPQGIQIRSPTLEAQFAVYSDIAIEVIRLIECNGAVFAAIRSLVVDFCIRCSGWSIAQNHFFRSGLQQEGIELPIAFGVNFRLAISGDGSSVLICTAVLECGFLAVYGNIQLADVPNIVVKISLEARPVGVMVAHGHLSAAIA